MTDYQSDVEEFDKFSNIETRALSLTTPIGPISALHCQLDEVFNYASHKKTRAKVTVTGPDGSKGLDNAMAWFPADDATFPGHPCISALLTTDGNINPSSHVVGWVQIHRGVVIWLGWGGDNNIAIDWKDVLCFIQTLRGHDQQGRQWNIDFDLWYAGFPPPWPPWLLD